MTASEIAAPEPLRAQHIVAAFDSGEASLDDWLKKRALNNQATGASRSFVISAGNIVIGYYCLASGAVEHALVPKAMTRNMPDPMPVLLLGRLAIDRAQQGRGLGAALLRDALLRAVRVSENAGVSSLLVHALHERATQFYLSRGFVQSPIRPMTLLLTLTTARKHLAETGQLG